MIKFKQHVKVVPAYDYTTVDRERGKRYGRHGVELRFGLSAKNKAVEICFFTSSMLANSAYANYWHHEEPIRAVFLTTHWRSRAKSATSCELIGKCRGSQTHLVDYFTEGMKRGGTDWIWMQLEVAWLNEFANEPWRLVEYPPHPPIPKEHYEWP